MKIFASLFKHKITLMIGEETKEFSLPVGFYLKAKNKNAYQFFLDKKTNTLIRNFIFYHRNQLSFFEKLKYMITRNEVTVVVDDYVRGALDNDIVKAYLTLACDAREVKIIQQ